METGCFQSKLNMSMGIPLTSSLKRKYCTTGFIQDNCNAREFSVSSVTTRMMLIW